MTKPTTTEQPTINQVMYQVRQALPQRQNALLPYFHYNQPKPLILPHISYNYRTSSIYPTTAQSTDKPGYILPLLKHPQISTPQRV
ncbi:hypothetical protein CVS40_0692 [Lucilia cuprina]|nr:hypothetical protein CVS40_0692 [Lucilia cuprina]